MNKVKVVLFVTLSITFLNQIIDLKFNNLYANPTTFIIVGDTPYSEKENIALHSTIKEAIKTTPHDFLIHLGDIKSGGESCTNELLKERRDDIYNLSPILFYTIGDNEWTDCDRDFLKERFSEIERLKYVRSIFFPIPFEVPKEWNYINQKDFPENSRWIKDNIVFATIHLVSTNNGRIDILEDNVNETLNLVDKRDIADKEWLNESFQKAKEIDAKAIVIATQADITKIEYEANCTKENRSKCDAFKFIREELIKEAKEFKKPILFIHGDTNPYCIDTTMAPNLIRLNAWGDFATPADVTKVVIDTNSSNIFKIESLLNKKEPENSCK